MIVTDRNVRASAFGYFGHMWELYAFWVLVPFILATRLDPSHIPTASFVAIGAGAQLAASAVCCVLAPLLLQAPPALFCAWLLIWGVTVVGDSPQFSTLTALNAPRAAVGSVLTFVNCIGFAISIPSIQLFAWLAQRLPLDLVLPWLALGPALGLLALRPLLLKSA